MAFSIRTNTAAFSALQTLNLTNQDLATTQNRINTGQAVSSTVDDSVAFAIAQNLRADFGQIGAAQASLDRADSTLDVAIAGLETVSDLLIRAGDLAAQAQDEGLDGASRTALNNEFTAIRNQIDSVVSQATFNGTNLIASGSNDQINALAGFDAAGAAININVSAAPSGSGSLAINGDNLTSATLAATARAAVDTDIATVNATLATFGAAARQIEIQRNFSDVLADTVQTGIGNLVDANLARESANLQSLQVRQQLGIQALSIANSAPQAILGLFG